MTASSYDEALARLLVHEGGYSNHPSDPGGPTNWGITIHDARAYWKKDATASDVRNMPVEVAKDIYRSKYWGAMRCDELPAGVDYAVFDYGVNSGIGRAGKVLRRVLDLADDELTDDVISVLKSKDPKAVVNAICDERLEFLQGLRTWSVFGNGWGRRVREVRAAALVMADHPDLSLPTPAPGVDRGPAPEPAPAKAGGKGRMPPVSTATKLGWGAVFVALVAGAAHAMAAHSGLSIFVIVVAALIATFFVKTSGNGD